MKKIVLVLFLLFCICAPAHAANFVKIIDEPDVQFYIDSDSIESRKDDNNEYVAAWVKYILLDNEYDIDYYLYLYAFNKNARQIQPLSEYVYDKKGRITGHQTWPFLVTSYKDNMRDSFGETMYDFVMKFKK